MNAVTAWYLGFLEKTAANRLAKWLADKRNIIEQIESPALRKEVAEEMAGIGERASGIDPISAISSKRRNIADYLTREQHAEKYPSLFGSEEKADRWLRDNFRPQTPYDPEVRWPSVHVDRLERPVGSLGRSPTDDRLFRRTTGAPYSPLRTLQRTEEGMGLAKPPSRAAASTASPVSAVLEAANIPTTPSPAPSGFYPFNFLSDAEVNRLIEQDAAQYAARMGQ